MLVENRWSRSVGCVAALLFTIALIAGQAAAQYTVTNLVSNQSGKAKTQDTDLVNAWGMSFASGGAFWISDEGTGLTTFYTGAGAKAGTVTIPPASGSGLGEPTGQVYNSTTGFQISQGGKSGASIFIFATGDGTISGWNPTVNASSAVIAVSNSGASYTGLAIDTTGGSIFAANTKSGKVEMYNEQFKLKKSFADSKLSGYVPYGIQNIGGQLYVAYVNFNTGASAVDIFTTAGKKVKTLTKSKRLNVPWGLALAPSDFGSFSNDLLVGNLGNGKINAFDPSTGKFIGALKNAKGHAISISGLWALEFGEGGGSNGNPNQLFFTAGPNGYANGLFGVINAQ